MPIEKTATTPPPIAQTAAEKTAAAQAAQDRQRREEVGRTRDEITGLCLQYASRCREVTGAEFSFPPQQTDYFNSSRQPEFALLEVQRPNQTESTLIIPLGYYPQEDQARLAALMPDGTAFPTAGAWNRAALRIASLPDVNGERHELVEGMTTDPTTQYRRDQIDSSERNPSITLSDGTTVRYNYFGLPQEVEQLKSLRDSLRTSLETSTPATQLPPESPERKTIKGQTVSERFEAQEAEAARLRKEQTVQTGREIEETSQRFLRRAQTVNNVQLEPGTAEIPVTNSDWSESYNYVPEFAVVQVIDPDGSTQTFTQPLAFIGGDRRQTVVVMADGTLHRLDGAWFRNELHTVSEPDREGNRYELVSGISQDPQAALHRDRLPASTLYKNGQISPPRFEMTDGRKLRYYWIELPDDLEGRQELLAGLTNTIKDKEPVVSP
jgi:hypothetical protein